MKLAEALALRADLQKRTAQLKSRIKNAAKVQEGDQPAEDPNEKQFIGTGWGVYNAITGYYSNVDNSTGIKRMDSLLYGDKYRKINLATKLILAA